MRARGYTGSIVSAKEPFDKIELLQLAFQGLDQDELHEMAKLSHFNSYREGHVLCQEGADEDVFYIIAEGNVVVTQRLSDDEGERVLREGGKGSVVGEMALIQNAPRSATVRATSPCTALEMDKQDFETILRRSPRLAIDIIRITLDRIRENDRAAIEELQQTNKILRQLDRNKLEFIQVAAHELRTPLTVLKGYVDLLLTLPDVNANTTVNNMLSGVSKGADRMHEIVNNMLDVSRIDSDTLEFAFVPVPLKHVIDNLVDNFKKDASARNIKLSTKHADNSPDIHANPGMIQKALQNLIVNAIKYTPDGGQVTVSTRATQLNNKIPGIEVAVQDTGIGLDPEHHELIFEKFYQVGDVALHSSGKTTFKGGGPGLGLALVRGVARAHSGKVWVESIGHDEESFPGSTFYLQLPVNPTDT